MYVYFANGTKAWFEDARDWRVVADRLELFTSRKRKIATCQLAAVVFWCFDSERVNVERVDA